MLLELGSSPVTINETPQTIQNFETPKLAPLPDLTLKDPLKFITKYKHWCNKNVKFKDGAGNQLTGTVTGLAFPNLTVEYSGGTLSMNPSEWETQLI